MRTIVSVVCVALVLCVGSLAQAGPFSDAFAHHGARR